MMINISQPESPDGDTVAAKTSLTRKKTELGGEDFSSLLQLMTAPLPLLSVKQNTAMAPNEGKNRASVVGSVQTKPANVVFGLGPNLDKKLQDTGPVPTGNKQPRTRDLGTGPSMPVNNQVLHVTRAQLKGLEMNTDALERVPENRKVTNVAGPTSPNSIRTAHPSLTANPATFVHFLPPLQRGFGLGSPIDSAKSTKSGDSTKVVREESPHVKLNSSPIQMVDSKDGAVGFMGLPTSTLVTHPTSHMSASATSTVDMKHANPSGTLSGIVVQQVKSGVDQFQVKVHPEGLGNLVISVHRTDQGLNVNIVASEAVTANWLQQERDRIVDAIQANGQQLNSFQSSLGDASAEQNRSGGQPDRQPAFTGGHPAKLAMEDVTVSGVGRSDDGRLYNINLRV